ncbi:MAG: HEAT repeat domain-containing protein [Pyrinomonadaceae bacterium]
MNNKKHLYRQIYKTLPALLIISTFYTAIMPETAFAFPKNSFVSKTNIQDDFDKKFREARDLIDREDWAKAAEKFDEVIKKYPNNKSTDAALYWLAFTYKKQKQFDKSDVALDRLLKEFPSSSWADDARVMKVQTSSSLGQVYFSSLGELSPNGSFGVFTTKPSEIAAQEEALKSAQTYFGNAALAQTLTTAARTPLDREDEIKIAAFQSLLSADPKRAIEIMGDILTTDSKASETLKLEILRVVRNPRLSVATRTTDLFTSKINTPNSNQFTPLLRETLVKSFQNESNIKIRKEIIYTLASFKDDQSANYLAQLYSSANDKEIKKAIINSFGSGYGNFYYSSSKINASGFSAGTASNRKIEFDKILEIIRTEKDSELRNLAFSILKRFPDWSAREGVIELLAELYDTAPDEPIKINIIRILADTKQAQASKKLLEIAKNDKSDKLKLEAIYSLRTSKNPEVLKFLEELIK